jgi:uncharacterized protein (TIGR02147 family)
VAQLSLSNFGDYREFLQAYVKNKQKTSKTWSYRVWARALGLKSPSTLTMIVNGQRHPGPKLVTKLRRQLRLNEHDGFYFENLIRLAKLRNDERQSLEILNQVKALSDENFTKVIDHQAIATLSSWYNWAIRELTKTRGFQSDPHWISTRLAKTINPIEVRQSISALIEFGILQRTESGQLESAEGHSKTSNDAMSRAIQAFHQQALSLIKDQLNTVSPDHREVSGVCFPIKLQDIGAAKLMIRNFEREFCERFESSNADEVYLLEVGFVPMTKLSPNDLQ